MFCYQCEQTAQRTGCTSYGVCGKDPETAALQDLLVEVVKGIAQYAHRARELGESDRELDLFVTEALFTTVTNVNFDAASLAAMVRDAAETRNQAQALYETACTRKNRAPELIDGPATMEVATEQDAMVRQGDNCGIARRLDSLGADVAGLEELVLYGVKGTAAYADHAHRLGQDDDTVYGFFHEALSFLADHRSPGADALTALALRVGEVNYRVMELLDRANTSTYGHPEPTKVRITPKAGKCILVSGHDLKDLADLLEQTAGRGINIYTHGEMLPCNAYPELKKHPHLAGHYGGAWQDQAVEFDAFPGAILMTTNCIQKPRSSYADRIFTCGLVRWPGVAHVPDGDFTPVIEAALAAPGFPADEPEQSITIGFGHQAVLGVADQVIDAVKSGAIRRFFLIGGCDGARSGRNYFTELAQQVPQDCVILTLACGKFRFNRLEFGDIGGIPRLLDMGQCNDAYSAIKVASALAGAFDCGVNDLPLSMVLSWYEQKAVCILLTLLHLGVKDIRLGPTLPAFVGPNVLQALVAGFGLKPTATAEEDLAAMLA